MGALVVFVWAVFAAVASAAIEHANGHATANAAHPDDLVFGLVLLAITYAGLATVRGGRSVRVGWALLGSGVGISTALLAHALAVMGLVHGNDGLGIRALVWVATWLLVPSMGLLPFVPAIWPTGVVDTRWLRSLTVVAALAVGALTVAQAFAPDHLDGVGPALAPVPNPLGLAGAAGAVSLVTSLAVIVLATYTLAVLVDAVLRYRTGDTDARSALRPLVRVIALLPITLLAGAALGMLLDQQPAVGLWAAGLVVLVGGIAVSFAIAERARRRAHRALADRRSTVEATARERRRLRRDLHDGLGPSLAALRLQLDSVRAALPPTAHEAASRLERVEATLTGALEELRHIVDGLRPVALDELGLTGAITSQARAISGLGAGPTVQVRVDPALPPLPDAVEVALLRVSAEALSNAVRHAGSSRCTVNLDWRDPLAVLNVQDDGVGIVLCNPGHGLATMRERVQELGGVLTVARAQPRGTIVTAVIPGAG